MFSKMSNITVNNKLKTVLYNLIQPNNCITNDLYLEKLLMYFQDDEKVSVCMEWIFSASSKLEEINEKPFLASFILKILALVVRDKKRYQEIEKENVITRVIDVMHLHNNVIPSIKLSYVSMLSSIGNHEDGCRYISEKDLWKDVVNYCYQDSSIYLMRECRIFITNFIISLLDNNPIVCENVIHHTLQPLIGIKNLQVDEINLQLKDSSAFSKLVVVAGIAYHLHDTLLFHKDVSLASSILNKFELETAVWKLLNAIEDSTLINILSKLLISMYFMLLQCKNTGEIAPSDFKPFETKLYNLLGFIVMKSGNSTLNILVQTQTYWYKLKPSVVCEPDKNSKPYIFENQILILQLMPVLCSIVTTRISGNELLDSYCNKLFDLTCESVLRLCYSFRDYIAAQDNRPESLHTGVLSLLEIKDLIPRDQAIIVFQALMYILKDFVPELDPNPPIMYTGLSSDEILIICPEVLASILEALTSLISCYRITWRESLETICLFSFMLQLLKNPNLSSKLAVKTLKLMQEGIQNFMPPNLALLVNTLEGSSINQLGPLLRKRMHDVSWEVRDSALEVLRVVTAIAEIKFTAFQDHILENDLCILCVAMAVDDLESYVRATALSCLCVMVRVEKFWCQSLSAQNLPEKMINILKFESEGIVRKEAAALMKGLFEHQKVPKAMADNVHDTMFFAVVKDLDWEVQINALEFWQTVIEQQMSNQGMIDGVFPAVTFSKENRKIVSLTEKEIKVRLGKVMEELSQLGCLQVLLSALEDCNPRVVAKAEQIIQYLSQLLYKYGVLHAKETQKPSVLPDLVSSNLSKCYAGVSQSVPVTDTFGADRFSSDIYRPPQKVARLVSNGEIESSSAMNFHNDFSGALKSSDQIIDGIVKDNDISLLQKVYQNHLQIHAKEETKVVPKCISSEEFLTKLTGMHLEKDESRKSEWQDYCSDDLNSLLDDILMSNSERESNAVDCY